MSSTCSRLFRTGCSNVVLVNNNVVETMLLTIDTLTMLFSHDNNIGHNYVVR